MSSSASRHLGQDFLFRPAQLQRSKGNLIEDCRIEELHIGILKDQRDPASKCQRVVIALEEFGRQPLAIEDHRALRGKVQSVENSQQRGFSGTVRTQQSDALSLSDLQRESAERGNAVVFEARVLQLEECRHRLVHLPIHTARLPASRKASSPK